MHGRHGATQVDADEGRLLCAEDAANRQDLFEGQAFDQFHPQPDRVLVPVHSVHRHDIRMPHSGEQSSFLNHGRRLVSFAQDFQSHFSLETRIPRDMTVPKRPWPIVRRSSSGPHVFDVDERFSSSPS